MPDAKHHAVVAEKSLPLLRSDTHVSMDSPDGQAAGLRTDSFIDCTVVATIPKALLVSKVGQLSAAILEMIDECIQDDPDGPR